MENPKIEKNLCRPQEIDAINEKINSALVLLKIETFKDRDSLTIDIPTQNLCISVPRAIKKRNLSRLSEIIYEGFQTFRLNPSDLGTKIPNDSVFKIGEYFPVIDALDITIDTANRLGKEMFLITDEGEESFVIPTGLKGGVDREDTDSDTLILIDAIDKGLKVHRYLPESE
ncbi:MAG: hypothetical protein ACOX06_03375 [Candidatus Dojkabacteria bacterium]|jgi:hypothetical protein